jgi:uncharacterized 2Fe-2S/4Fe-4S cluster protein (DUF4445 family)
MRLEILLPSGTESIIVKPADQHRKLTEILRHENIPLNTRCGEKGLCRACQVDIVENGQSRTVKACEFPLEGLKELTVQIPQSSLLAYEPEVQEDYRVNVPIAHNPICGTSGIGVAVDVGTTTVVVQLVDLESGKVLSRASAFNHQMHLGDDVLTRINLCSTDDSMLPRMQQAIIHETLVPLVSKALEEAKRQVHEIKGYAIAGNTTMLHLVAGVNPKPLGYHPFEPVFIEHKELSASEIGLHPKDAQVHLLPGAAGYVGADLTGGVFASGLIYDDGPSLLVDVGTNGEIIYKHGGQLLGCATAAGPAFEGSGLTCGIRAGIGAISHVTFTKHPFQAVCELIHPERYAKPLGICGSAYVDILAEGRRKGFLTTTGRWDVQSCPSIEEHLVPFGEYGRALRLAYGQGQREIVVADPDIASLMQAKAAIAAGVLILMKRTGMEPKDVKTLYLAGGFGMHLDQQSAIDCGLLPGFKVEQIQLVGNTSLAGAYLSIMDQGALQELGKIGKQMEIVELNLDPEFEETYIDQLMLP